MLSQLLFVRLKAAENALRDGRLDEAYRLATAPDIREHRRGAAVLAAVTERLIERARNHYRADRFSEALLDLDKAEAGGVRQEDIAELRRQVQVVAAEMRRRDESRQQRVEAARRRIEDGSLLAGRRILEQASETDPAAQQLRRVAEGRVEDAREAVRQAETMIRQGHLAAAAERLQRARRIDAHGEAVLAAEGRLCQTVLGRAREAFLNGRLGRAADELACLGPLGDQLPDKRELRDALAIAKAAARLTTANQYGEARRQMIALARAVPEASWVHQTMEQLGQIEDLRTAMMAGPLGDRYHETKGPPREGPGTPGRPATRAVDPAPARSLDDTLPLPGAPKETGQLPTRLLMHVDGGGSYLIVRSGQVSIGRAASRHPADVPVFSDISERQANISRVDDDYFLFAASDVEVAGRRTRHHLLQDGNRIVLGRKAKFTFRLPTRKSPTAVLDLSDTTKMPHDVRRVVLFYRHATMGTAPAAHIRCMHAGTPMVLFEREGALWIRQRNDGHTDTDAMKLTLGQPIEFAGASFVIEAW